MVASVATMGTLRLGALAALLLAVVPAGAHAAQDQPMNGFGCPQGFIAFDAQTGQGGPASYPPGAEAVASGYLTDATTKAAPSVTLRWGTPDGEALGEAALDRDGNFQGLRFTIPADRPDGVHTVYLEAFGADGKMLPGLPIPVQLRVGPPPATDTPDAGATAEPESTVARTQRRAASRRPSSPRPAPAPAPRDVAARPAPASRAAAKGATAPVTKPRTSRAASPSRTSPAPLRTGGPQPRPVAPAVDTPVIRRPSPADAKRHDGTADPADLWLLVALVGLPGLGVAALRRRREPVAPPRQALTAPDRDAVIEAALQELIAEEHAARRRVDDDVLV